MKIKLNGKIMNLCNMDSVYNANNKVPEDKRVLATYKHEGYLNGKKISSEKGLNIFAKVKKLDKDEIRLLKLVRQEEVTNYGYEKEKKRQIEKCEVVDVDGNVGELKCVKTLIKKYYPQYMICCVEVSKRVYDKFIKELKKREEFVLDLDK